MDWALVDAMARMAEELPVGTAMEDVLHLTVDAQLMRRSRNIVNACIMSKLRDRVEFDRARNISGEGSFDNFLDNLQVRMPQGDTQGRLRWIDAGMEGYVKLEELLIGTREFDSTDERDKVFAVLGMVLDPAMATRLPRPDYHSHFSEVYMKTAESVFRSGTFPAFLLVLAGFGLRRFQDMIREPSTPSWVPELRCPRGHLSAVTIREHAEKPAGEELEMQITVGQDGRSLETSTAIVDEIVEVGPIHKDPSLTCGDFEAFGWRESMRHWHCWLQETKVMAQRMSEHHCHARAERDIDIEDEYWRTLFLNRISERTGDAELSTANLDFIKEKFEACVAIYIQLEATISNPWDDSELRRVLEGDLTQLVLFAKILESLKINTMGRRFCHTRNRLFAIAPPLVQMGDVVCFFKGSNGPWLLRPVAVNNIPGSSNPNSGSSDGTIQRYQFVGACYVRRLEYPQPRSGNEFRKTIII
jgi:hypothetical protein